MPQIVPAESRMIILIDQLLECSFSAFQNLANLFSDCRILKAATLLGEFRKIARPMRATSGNNHLIGVCIHYQIGIVRDDDDLPP